MTQSEANKAVIRTMIDVVWVERDLDRLAEFLTPDCINHAMNGATGLGALRAYHEGFFAAFDAFSDVKIEVVGQIAEGEQVVTRLVSTGRHSGDFMGLSPTGKTIRLDTVRIDRLRAGKLAEHWSVADMAGLLAQLQG